MGQLAMTIVGGVIGSFFGMPQLGMMIGGMLGSALFGPTIKGPRLNDLNVSASTYGNAIPVLYGTYRMGSNMIWTAGIKEKKKKSGGMGKGGPKQTTYTYSASFAVAFCVGEAQDIVRIWADSKLIYGAKKVDLNGKTFWEFIATAMSGGSSGKGGSGGKKKKSKYKFRAYMGSEDQLPDSVIVAKEGAGKVPGYRGLVYLVFEKMPLEDFGNRIPSISAEITKKPNTDYPSLTPMDTDGNFSSGDYSFIDFDADKLVRKIGTEHVTYSYSTMTEIDRVVVAGGTSAMTRDGKYYVGTEDATNYKPFCIYDAATGALLRKIGGNANLGGSYHIKDGQAMLPDDAQARFWAWGEINTIWVPNPLTGGEHYFVGYDQGDGDECIYQVPSGKLVFNIGNRNAGLGSVDQFCPGIESIYGSEYYRFFNNAGAITRAITFIPPGCNTIIQQDEGANQWTIIVDPRITQTVQAGIGIGTLGIADISTYESLNYTTSCYDRSDDSTIVFATATKSGSTTRSIAFKMARDGSIRWAKRLLKSDGSEADLPGSRIRRSRIEGGSVGWVSSSSERFYLLDATTGSMSYKGSISSSIGDGWTSGAWDDLREAYVGNGTSYGAGLFIINAGSDQIGVADVVQDICLRTGTLTADDIDVTDIANVGTVRGYLISRECTAKDCLQQLATAFFFDGVESDYKLKFIKRGNALKGTISESRMGFVEGRDINLKETRAQELELPMRLTVNYADFDRDYQVAAQFSKRITNPFPTMHSNKQDKIELPLAWDATSAKQFTDKALKMSWMNRVTASAMLPWEMLKYDPTDVLEFVMDSGTRYLLRLTKVNLGVDYKVEVEGVTEDSIAYVSSAVGDPGSVPIQDAGGASPAKAVICNTPLLRDIDDTQGVGSVFYIGGTPTIYGAIYSPAVLMQKRGDGEYSEIDLLEVGVNMGMCLDTLPDTQTWGSIDETTVLRVRMWDPQDTLSSCTMDELLAGKNMAIIGKEVIQFRDAVLGDDGLYRLTGILRARRGTNKWVKGHVARENFIFLAEDGSLSKEYHELALASDTYTFKAVAGGQYEAEATEVGAEFEPNDLKPYSPEDFRIKDDGTTITVEFARRSRITDEMRDYGGDAIFRDGDTATAQMRWVAYFGNWPIEGSDPKSVYEADPSAPVPGPGLSGSIPIMTGSSYTDLKIEIPLSKLTTDANDDGDPSDNKHFVLYVWQTGFVDGFVKKLKFERLGANVWNVSSAY